MQALLPSPSQPDSWWLHPTDSPGILMGPDQSRSFCRATHNAGGGWLSPPWVIFAHWRSQRQHCPGQRGNVVSVWLSLLLSNAVCVCLSGAGGASISPSCPSILSVVSCSCRVVSCSSEKEQCQDNSGPYLGDVTLGYLRVLLFTIRLVRPRGLRERL